MATTAVLAPPPNVRTGPPRPEQACSYACGKCRKSEHHVVRSERRTAQVFGSRISNGRGKKP